MGTYDCTLGFYTHQKYIQVSQTLSQAKKEPRNYFFRFKPSLAKNWLKTWLKLAKRSTDQKTELTCRTGSLCQSQKWSYFWFLTKDFGSTHNGGYMQHLDCPLFVNRLYYSIWIYLGDETYWWILLISRNSFIIGLDPEKGKLIGGIKHSWVWNLERKTSMTNTFCNVTWWCFDILMLTK